jgi:hypothetical protein
MGSAFYIKTDISYPLRYIVLYYFVVYCARWNHIVLRYTIGRFFHFVLTWCTLLRHLLAGGSGRAHGGEAPSAPQRARARLDATMDQSRAAGRRPLTAPRDPESAPRASASSCSTPPLRGEVCRLRCPSVPLSAHRQSGLSQHREFCRHFLGLPSTNAENIKKCLCSSSSSSPPCSRAPVIPQSHTPDSPLPPSLREVLSFPLAALWMTAAHLAWLGLGGDRISTK